MHSFVPPTAMTSSQFHTAFLSTEIDFPEERMEAWVNDPLHHDSNLTIDVSMTQFDFESLALPNVGREWSFPEGDLTSHCNELSIDPWMTHCGVDSLAVPSVSFPKLLTSPLRNSFLASKAEETAHDVLLPMLCGLSEDYPTVCVVKDRLLWSSTFSSVACSGCDMSL